MRYVVNREGEIYAASDVCIDPPGHWVPIESGEGVARRGRGDGTRVDVRRGSEGPRHDPYGWTEITVTRLGIVATIRESGLGYCSLTVGSERGESRASRSGCDEGSRERIRAEFVRVAGEEPEWFAHWHETARRRCPSCRSSRHVDAMGSGYVGETVYGCTKCGVPMFDDFHLSMIE